MIWREPNFSLLSIREKRKITALRAHLLGWYAANGRDLPWRDFNTSTFQKICVEVLLQRTRAETVAKVYPQFFGRYRNWAELAEAPISELEEQLRPIGLWRRRAVSIKGLSSFAAERDGCFPHDPQELAKVQGVGQYVLNAILLFQYGKRRPLIDVNMARVLERFIRPRELADIRHDPWLQAASFWLIRQQQVETNWAVLDFAAAVCTSRSPSCNSCIVRRECSWATRYDGHV